MLVNPWETVNGALQTCVRDWGAVNYRVISAEPTGNDEWLFTVEADSWTVPSPFGPLDEGNTRRWQIGAMGDGSAVVTPISYGGLPA